MVYLRFCFDKKSDVFNIRLSTSLRKDLMRESIFSSAIRSFFLVLLGTAGLLCGIILVIILLGSVSTSTDGDMEISYTYTPEIKPNADGIRKSLPKSAPVILKININGVIGLESITAAGIRQQLVESRERILANDRVKALLLFIDTPGGTATDADGIYRAIKEYKKAHNVPVYAFVDGLCASGGMYIASAADKIFATEASLIGSVGVLLPTAFNFTQLLEKIGVQSLTLYDGKGKDNLNPFRPWQKGEEANIKEAIDFFYMVFVDIVTNNRPRLSKEKLVEEYGANIFPSPLALEYGYIDEAHASLRTTIKQLAEKIGAKDDDYQVVEMMNKNWVSQLFRTELSLLKGEINHHHQLELPLILNPKLQNQFLYLYIPGK